MWALFACADGSDSCMDVSVSLTLPALVGQYAAISSVEASTAAPPYCGAALNGNAGMVGIFRGSIGTFRSSCSVEGAN